MTITEEAIKELVGIVRDSKEFVIDQAPSVAVEMVRYGRIWIIVPLLIILIGIPYLIFAFIKAREGKWENEWSPAFFIPLVLGIFILALIVGESKAIMAWVAPKLYILTELSRMAK